MSAPKVIFPVDYKECLHTLIDCHVEQGLLLSTLLKKEVHFDTELRDMFKEDSSSLLVLLDQKMIQGVVHMNELISRLKTEGE